MSCQLTAAKKEEEAKNVAADEEKKEEEASVDAPKRAMHRACDQGRDCEAFKRLLAYQYNEDDLAHCEDR